MCDKELLVAYLYDELGPAERSRFETHLFTCVQCREEVAALRATRGHLASWAPPVPDLGFQIVRGDDRAQVGRRRLRLAPALGLAAAAALVLAVASAVANLEVKVGSDGLVVRTGRGAPPAAAPVPPVVPSAGAESAVAANRSDEAWRAELRLLETRLGELEAAAVRQRAPDARAAAAPGPRLTDEDLLRRVRELVAQSETRQQRELALQIAQVTRDWDMQRRADLVRIQQGLGRLEAYTGAEVAQQREMLNRFVRVSQGR